MTWNNDSRGAHLMGEARPKNKIQVPNVGSTTGKKIVLSESEREELSQQLEIAWTQYWEDGSPGGQLYWRQRIEELDRKLCGFPNG